MKLGVILGAIAGLALATILIVHFGWREIVDAAVAAGWQGLLAITLIYFVCLALIAAAWQMVILDPPWNLFFSCLWSRWLRESVGNLLALSQPPENSPVRASSLFMAFAPEWPARAPSSI